MTVERIIGVDFGTSTSVIRVKRYEDGEPVNGELFAQSVVFNMGSTVVPTLIRKKGDDVVYGFTAEVAKKDSVLYQNFKVQLESDDPQQKAQARALTAEFLKYLAGAYREQSDGGHLGDANDKERTIISYPVKWSRETKAFMIESAKAAGFPNVTGMDEASAAILAATVQNEETLRKKGLLTAGKPLNILLLDMGAGTTDLVLCRHTPGSGNKILNTYPKAGDVLFGGREIDALLGQYIAETVPVEYRSVIVKKIGLEKYKAWKEAVVSHSLKVNEPIEYFAALDDLADAYEFDAEFRLDRAAFENLLSGYLPGLPKLVNGCLREAGMTGADVDLVILTGGHSQWYFVEDILTGKNRAYGDCGLDNASVISISLPQETVALGLAFSGLQVEKPKPQPKPESKPNPQPKPNPEPVKPVHPEKEEVQTNNTYLFVTRSCPNCKVAEALLDKASVGYKKVNADTNEAVDLVEKYGVRQCPTLVVVKDGQIEKFVNLFFIKSYIVRVADENGEILFKDLNNNPVLGLADGSFFTFSISGKQIAKLVRGKSHTYRCKYPAGTYELITKVYAWNEPYKAMDTMVRQIEVTKDKTTEVNIVDMLFGIAKVKIDIKNPV